MDGKRNFEIRVQISANMLPAVKREVANTILMNQRNRRTLDCYRMSLAGIRGGRSWLWRCAYPNGALEVLLKMMSKAAGSCINCKEVSYQNP